MSSAGKERYFRTRPGAQGRACSGALWSGAPSLAFGPKDRSPALTELQ